MHALGLASEAGELVEGLGVLVDEVLYLFFAVGEQVFGGLEGFFEGGVGVGF